MLRKIFILQYTTSLVWNQGQTWTEGWHSSNNNDNENQKVDAIQPALRIAINCYSHGNCSLKTVK